MAFCVSEQKAKSKPLPLLFRSKFFDLAILMYDFSESLHNCILEKRGDECQSAVGFSPSSRIRFLSSTGNGVKMFRLRLRPWDSVDQALQWIGRGACWLLRLRHSTKEGGAADAMIGGAIVYAVLGGVIGFALTGSSRHIGAMDGTIFGAFLGACLGIMFGAFVESVDHTIKDVLKSLD